MKKTILILALVIFAQVTNAQKNGTGLKKYGLKSNVKQITDYVYTSVGVVTLDTLRPSETSIIEFDTCGNVSKETLYNKLGVVDGKIVYNYAVSRTIVINYFDGKDSLESQSIDKYDKNGYEVEYDHRNVHGTITKFVFKNNKFGQFIEQKNYVKNDELNLIIATRYDDKGQKKEEDFFRRDGEQIDKCLFTNDSLKNSKHDETYDMNGKLQSTSDAADNLFDLKGNWQERKIETFHHTQNAGDITEKVLIRRKVEYY